MIKTAIIANRRTCVPRTWPRPLPGQRRRRPLQRDAAASARLADAAHLEWHRKPTYARNDGHRYVRTLADLRQNPGCIGFHLCGAFQRNRTRRWGLLDENEQPDVENVAAIRDANRETLEWVTGTSQQAGT